MKTSTKTLTAGILSLVIAGTSFTAFSVQGDSDKNESELISQATVGVDQAIAIALADVPGKVVETEIEEEDGKLVWEVEVVDSANQVFEFEIDANDGRILEKEQDDD